MTNGSQKDNAHHIGGHSFTLFDIDLLKRNRL